MFRVPRNTRACLSHPLTAALASLILLYAACLALQDWASSDGGHPRPTAASLAGSAAPLPPSLAAHLRALLASLPAAAALAHGLLALRRAERRLAEAGEESARLSRTLAQREAELQIESHVRQRLDWKLREFVAEYGQVMHQVAEGIAVMDREGNLMEVNDALCRLTGRSRNELLLAGLTALHPDERGGAEFREWLRQARREGKAGGPAWLHCPDGTPAPIEWRIRLARGTGRLVCVAGPATENPRRAGHPLLEVAA